MIQENSKFEETAPQICIFLWLKTAKTARSPSAFYKCHVQGKGQRYSDVIFSHSVHVTDADATFFGGPGMLTMKIAKQVYNSTRMALLKHGFVPVKTWLLLLYGTGMH